MTRPGPQERATSLPSCAGWYWLLAPVRHEQSEAWTRKITRIVYVGKDLRAYVHNGAEYQPVPVADVDALAWRGPIYEPEAWNA